MFVAGALSLAACGSTTNAAATTAEQVVVSAPTTAGTTSTTSPPASTEPASTTTTSLVLPTPVDLPSDQRAPEPEKVIGSITIPRLGVDVPLHDGISLVSIDRGPSHWPGTALPGDPGNVVIAGHRVTHTHPFLHIDEMRNGDEVIFTYGSAKFIYVMVGSEIVDPDGVFILTQTSAKTATLFACHPPGRSTQRYVVHLAFKESLPLKSA